jgi:hypothetical protein
MLFLLGASAPVWGTCTFTSYNFTQTDDSYVDVPPSGHDPTTIYRDVDLSGTTSMTPSNCAPSQIKHYAVTYNQIGPGSGGYVTGAYVCVTCFTESHNVQTTPFVDEEVTSSQDSGDVNCTLNGQFFYVPSVGNDLEVATTKSIQVGQSTNFPQYWKLSAWCTPDSSPPDWNPNAINPQGGTVWPYYVSLNICQRRKSVAPGTPWNCFTTIRNPMVYPETNTNKSECTNFDLEKHVDIFVDTDYFTNTWLIIKTALGL